MNLFSMRFRLVLLCGALLAAAGVSGCQRVAPVRTLPSWVRGIYVPVMENKSFEPGLETIATKAVQQAFIEDGRVDIVPRENADLVLVGTILDWKTKSSHTTGDHVTTNEDATMTVNLKLFEPLNMDQPVADLGNVVVQNGFYIDVRSTDYVPEPDRMSAMMNQFGSMALDKVVTGFPTQLRNAPPDALLPPSESADEIQTDRPLKARPGADAN